jgi:signal transduction histidine kinase
VRLYQDGLPVCGREEEIVRDLAGSGSQNHQILLELIARGARLTGSESPSLLLEEYELARQLLVGLTNQAPEEAQLLRSEKLAALGVMAGGIAHEIRNPLAVVSTAAINAMLDGRRARTAAGALVEMSSLANERERLGKELERWERRRAEIEQRLAEIAAKEERLEAFVCRARQGVSAPPLPLAEAPQQVKTRLLNY